MQATMFSAGIPARSVTKQAHVSTHQAAKNQTAPTFSGWLGQKSAQPVVHQRITVDANNKVTVPDHVIMPFIEGDGIGPEILNNSRRVVDSVLKLAYGNKKTIQWEAMLAGKKALAAGEQELLPQKTLDTIKESLFFVKAPMDTPTGGGYRSLNVTLREMFKLDACIRPIKNMPGVVTPMKKDATDIVIFRMNSQDTYAGIEFERGTQANKEFRELAKKWGHDIPEDAGIGIKFIGEAASKKLVRQAIQYAIDNNRPSVTLVHKGNINKFTEGAFLKWGKEVAADEFGDKIIFQQDFWKEPYNGDYSKLPKGKIVIQEKIADAMHQEIILNPGAHSVIATTNMNGDYLSDAAAATVGGLGLAPGANVGERYAMFEATHGTAPDIAGKNIANPTATMLSLVMMLNHMGWGEAAQKLIDGINATLKSKQMTGDLARSVPNAKKLSTSEFSDAVIKTMEKQNRSTLGRLAQAAKNRCFGK